MDDLGIGHDVRPVARREQADGEVAVVEEDRKLLVHEAYGLDHVAAHQRTGEAGPPV